MQLYNASIENCMILAFFDRKLHGLGYFDKKLHGFDRKLHSNGCWAVAVANQHILVHL